MSWKLFPRSCSLIFGNSQKLQGLKSSEYAEWPINLTRWVSKYFIVLCWLVCWCIVMVNNEIIEMSMILHLFQNIWKSFICIPYSYNCSAALKRNDCIKTRFHKQNCKHVFANRTLSTNFGWVRIIACHPNLTLPLRLWIIIIEPTFNISDDIIHTFSPIAVELVEHFQAIINTVLFLSFSQKMRHPTTCNLP